MRKIILEDDYKTISLSAILNDNTPIFAKLNGVLVGMLVRETSGWILRLGGSTGASGFHPSLRACIEDCMKDRYEFYIE